MRVLICGDRDWTDREKIAAYLKTLPKTTTVIHGGARGADRIAGKLAKKHGHEVKVYHADWSRYGRAAGPIRNRQMLEEGKPDLVVAFHANPAASRGTRNMLKQAREACVKTRVIA